MSVSGFHLQFRGSDTRKRHHLPDLHPGIEFTVGKSVRLWIQTDTVEFVPTVSAERHGENRTLRFIRNVIPCVESHITFPTGSRPAKTAPVWERN